MINKLSPKKYKFKLKTHLFIFLFLLLPAGIQGEWNFGAANHFACFLYSVSITYNTENRNIIEKWHVYIFLKGQTIRTRIGFIFKFLCLFVLVIIISCHSSHTGLKHPIYLNLVLNLCSTSKSWNYLCELTAWRDLKNFKDCFSPIVFVKNVDGGGYMSRSCSINYSNSLDDVNMTYKNLTKQMQCRGLDTIWGVNKHFMFWKPSFYSKDNERLWIRVEVYLVGSLVNWVCHPWEEIMQSLCKLLIHLENELLLRSLNLYSSCMKHFS